MGNVVDFQVKGLKELDARVQALQREFGSDNVPAGKWLMRALHDGARVIRDEAKRRAPVLQDTTRTYTSTDRRVKTYEGTKARRKGALRDGIVEHTDPHHYNSVVVRVRSRGYIFAAARAWGRRVTSALAGNPNYWWLVEFGTSHAPAQPFLRPAFEAKKGEALRVVRDSLARGLDAIVKQLQSIRRAA